MAKKDHQFKEYVGWIRDGILWDKDAINTEFHEIDDGDIPALIEAVKDKPNFTTLNLKGGTISDEGAKLLAEFLRDNTTITKLVLNNNYIGAEGAKALGDMLKTNTALRILSLSFNDIGDEGLIGVAEGLEKNTGLQSISLFATWMGDASAKRFGKAFAVNETLEQFCALSNNRMSEEGRIALFRSIPDHPYFAKFDLEDDELSPEAQEEVQDIIANQASSNLVKIHSREGRAHDVTYQRSQAAGRLAEELLVVGNFVGDIDKLAQFHRLRPGIRRAGDVVKGYGHYYDQYFKQLDAILDGFPSAQIDETLSVEKLAAPAEDGKVSVLQNPRTADQFGQIIDQLAENGERIGATALLEKGVPTELCKALIENKQMGNVFSVRNWKGAAGEMRAVYNRLPDEGKKQVHDWPGLQARVARASAAEQER